MRLNLSLALLCGLLASLAHGGTLTAELNKTAGGVDDSFALTVSIEGDLDGDIEVPEIDGLALSLVNNQRMSSWVNGKSSSQRILTWEVTVDKPGTYTIPSFKLKIDGKVEASLPLTLRVSGSSPSGPSSSSPHQQDQTDAEAASAPSGADLAERARAALKKSSGVFMDRSCAKNDPYIGEAVLCKVLIYTPITLHNPARRAIASPDLRVINAEGERRSERVLASRRYLVFELTEIIVPQKSGEVNIPPAGLQAMVLNSNFFSFGQGKSLSIESAPLKWQVKPLPKNPYPSQQTPLIGEFKIEAQKSKDQIKVGESVTITIDISGYGPLLGIKEPNLVLDKNFKSYADKPTTKEDTQNPRGLYSQSIFKQAIVASKEGNFSLGKIEIPTFDPQTAQYSLLQADLGSLQVQPGEHASAQALVVTSNNQALVPNANTPAAAPAVQDLVEPHRQKKLYVNQYVNQEQMVEFFAMALSPWLFAFVWMGVSSGRRLWGKRPQKYDSLLSFQEKLQQAGQSLDQGYAELALQQAYQALRGYLGDHLNSQASSQRKSTALTRRDIEMIAQRHGIDTVKDLNPWLDLLESMEFSGIQASSLKVDDARLALANFATLVDRMEQKHG